LGTTRSLLNSIILGCTNEFKKINFLIDEKIIANLKIVVNYCDILVRKFVGYVIPHVI